MTGELIGVAQLLNKTEGEIQPTRFGFARGHD